MGLNILTPLIFLVAGVLVAFKYRMYPKAWQEGLLKSCLATLCVLYNELRDLKWEAHHSSDGRRHSMLIFFPGGAFSLTLSRVTSKTPFL